MKSSRQHLRNTLTASLLAFTFYMQYPAPGLASETSPMQAESATTDTSTTPAVTPPAADSAAPANVLSGQAETMKFELAATKLSSGSDMSNQDFRDLQIGTLGFMANQNSMDNYPRVTGVFAGSPAEQAGIQVGDRVLSSDSIPNAIPGSWDQDGWRFRFDRAGTQSQLTIKRGKETLSFTLTRMNIEDLPDPKLRKMYEQQAKKLPPSHIGTVQGHSSLRKLGLP